MSQIWSEPYDPLKHRDQMHEIKPSDAELRRMRALGPSPVMFVRVCSFTFEFHSLRQLKTCLEYYAHDIQPSSRMNTDGADHWECQRWFERLPQFLLEKSKRQRVVSALENAVHEFDTEG